MAFIPENALLKMARRSAMTNLAGNVQIDTVIPSGGRVISSLKVWFNNHDANDVLRIVELRDGSGTIRSIIDDELAAPRRGWYFPPDGIIDVVDYLDGRLLRAAAGLTLRVEAQKGGVSLSDTLYINIMWGWLSAGMVSL